MNKIENWMGNTFKHDNEENSKIGGKYREDRSKYWQVYDRWLDKGKDIDALWLDYESGCGWELFVRLPKSVVTRDLVITICEEIMQEFKLERERGEYWWVEKDGKNKTTGEGFGWHYLLGILYHITGIKTAGGIFHKGHPKFWEIMWKHIPSISVLINKKTIIEQTIHETNA